MSLPRNQREQFQGEVFTRHLQTLELDCNRGDQLTRELEDLVRCVQTGSRPRVPGEAGRDAIALAERILQSVQTHRWNNSNEGPIGPNYLPEPKGWLFQLARPSIDAA
jgi:predicted dehydrogenase